MNRSGVMWSIKELIETLTKRQMNEFDANFVVTGKRGEGKSTLIHKMFLRFANFNQWKHQVYARDDVIALMKEQTYGLCWDDEAINSGYKRDFQSKGQQELIKIVTAYRDNFNIYASAIPFFYSLDKDMRDLVFMHIHIIERGLAVIFLQLEDSIHQQDTWDTKNNQRLEDRWQKKIQENPNFRIPYHRLSTFAGYLIFGKLTPKQEKKYKEIKKTKRAEAFKSVDEQRKDKEVTFLDKVYNRLMSGQLTRESLIQICLLEGKKYTSISAKLNEKLKNEGISDKSVRNYLKDDKIYVDKDVVDKVTSKWDFD